MESLFASTVVAPSSRLFLHQHLIDKFTPRKLLLPPEGRDLNNIDGKICRNRVVKEAAGEREWVGRMALGREPGPPSRKFASYDSH